MTPQIHKSIYFTFFGYLSHVCTITIHLPQWTTLVQPTIIVLPSAMFTHAPTSSKSCITCWVSFDSSWTPLNFLFPKPIPKTQNIKVSQETKKKTMKINNNVTPQQSGMVMHHTHSKLKIKTKIAKYEKNKTNKMCHDSIPMVPRKAQTKHSSRFHGSLFSMESFASYFHLIISVSINIKIHQLPYLFVPRTMPCV